MTTLLSELRNDALSAKLFPALFVGGLTGGLLLIESLVLANVIFVGPLSPYVSNGIGMLLLGYAAFCVLVALTSGQRGMMACPQGVSAAVLATTAVTLTRVMDGAGGEALFMSMVVVLILSTTITSLLFLVLGHWRLANLLRFVPYPVARGVLAGAGWVLCAAALSMMCGLPLEWRTLPRLLEPALVLKWGTGIAFCLGLALVMKRWNNYLAATASFAIAAGLYHLGFLLADVTVEQATEAGLLFGGMPRSGVWPAFRPGDLAFVDWGSVAAVSPILLTATLVTLLKLAMNLHGLELDAGRGIDVDREFRAAGFAGLVAAAGGSPPGCQSFGYSRLSRMLGADSRLTGIVAAGVVSLCALFGGQLVALMPVPLTAGVLLFVGAGLLAGWAFRTREKLRWTDHGVVLLTCATVATFGFVEGIGLGLIAAMVLLVIRLGRMDVIETEFTGRDRCSSRRRSIPERAILLDQGRRIRVYRLRGLVFFGSVHRLLARVKAALSDMPRPACVVLDLARVTGFDFSAVNALCGFVRSTYATGTRIVLAAAPELFQENLRRNLPADVRDGLLFAADEDHGIERGEDVILAGLQDAAASGHLLERVFDEMKHYLDRQIVFEEMVDRLEPWLEPRDYEAGDALAAQGTLQEGAQLIVKGQASVYDRGGTRISRCGPGAAVEPQAAVGSSIAAGSTIADASCRTMLLTPHARLLLEAFDPSLGLQFYRFLLTRAHGFVDDVEEPPAGERAQSSALAQLVGGHAGGARVGDAAAAGERTLAGTGRAETGEPALAATGGAEAAGERALAGAGLGRQTA